MLAAGALRTSGVLRVQPERTCNKEDETADRYPPHSAYVPRGKGNDHADGCSPKDESHAGRDAGAFDSRGTAKRKIAGGRRRRHRCVRCWIYQGPLHFRETHGAECGRALFGGRRNRSCRRRQDRAGCVPGLCAAGAGKTLSIPRLATACATPTHVVLEYHEVQAQRVEQILGVDDDRH